jgi:hypothetical protein
MLFIEESHVISERFVSALTGTNSPDLVIYIATVGTRGYMAVLGYRLILDGFQYPTVLLQPCWSGLRSRFLGRRLTAFPQIEYF